MGFSFFVGLRFLGAKRRNRFMSFLSMISIAGLMLGVAVLIIVLSVMNGFSKELKGKILGVVPHASLTSHQPIQDWQPMLDELTSLESIEGASVYNQVQGLLVSDFGKGFAQINGVHMESLRDVSILGDTQYMTASVQATLEQNQWNIVLGDLLAKNLGVIVGDKVNLITGDVNVSIAGASTRGKRFTVTGTFSTKSEVDSSIALISYKKAAILKRQSKESITHIRLKVDDLFASRAIGYAANEQLGGGFMVSDWTHTYGTLFQAVALEKRMMGLLLGLIVAVAMFNIVSSMVMLVNDKRGDIAILRTMGATKSQILGVFLVQGTMIGVLGTIVGVVLGVIVSINVSAIVGFVESVLGISFLGAGVYFIQEFPSDLQWSDVGYIAGYSFVLSIVATLYPAFNAASTLPAQALRNEN